MSSSKSTLDSFGDGLRVVVIGASGGIGEALLKALSKADNVDTVFAYARSEINFYHEKIKASPIDIIDEDIQSATVQLGSHVILRDPEGKQYRYILVGAAEALPSQGKLSEQSPLGQALIGKKKGQQFSFAAPKGEVTFKVTKVG